MKYVELGKDNLRSHFVFRPRHAPEWLRARFPPVVFLANEEELTGKTFTTSLNTTNPNTYVKFIFLRTSPLTSVAVILKCPTVLAVILKCDSQLHFPFPLLFCCLYWDPLSSCESAPVSIYGLIKQVDPDMRRFSKSLLFFFFCKDGSDQLVRRTSWCWYFFSLRCACYCLLEVSLVPVAHRACDSFGTFNLIVTHWAPLSSLESAPVSI